MLIFSQRKHWTQCLYHVLQCLAKMFWRQGFFPLLQWTEFESAVKFLIVMREINQLHEQETSKHVIETLSTIYKPKKVGIGYTHHPERACNLFMCFLRCSLITTALKCQTFQRTAIKEKLLVLNISQSETGPSWWSQIWLTQFNKRDSGVPGVSPLSPLSFFFARLWSDIKFHYKLRVFQRAYH